MNTLRLLFIFLTASGIPLYAAISPLSANFMEAEKAFAAHYASVERVQYSENSVSCYRTGYHFDLQKILFCGSEYVRQGGIYSRDVVFHEAFHAMVCQLRPDWCQKAILQNPEAVAIHEALADFFARSFDSTIFFGENYYKSHPWIRPYDNSLCLGMASNAYHRAGAINAYWREQGFTLNSIREYIFAGELSFKSLVHFKLLTGECALSQASLVPTDGEVSSLSRYRLPIEGKSFSISLPQTLQHYLKAQYGVLSYSLIEESGEETVDYDLVNGVDKFTIIPRATWKRAKYFISVQDRTKRIVGLFPIYLSVQSSKRTSRK